MSECKYCGQEREDFHMCGNTFMTTDSDVAELHGWSKTVQLTVENRNRLEWPELSPLGVALTKAADRIESLQREKEAFRKAGAILLGCLNDAKELGLTVAVCGIEPDVMAALREQEEG